MFDVKSGIDLLKQLQGEPVYLTKNGRGRFVIMDIEDYERDRCREKASNKAAGSRRSSERW